MEGAVTAPPMMASAETRLAESFIVLRVEGNTSVGYEWGIIEVDLLYGCNFTTRTIYSDFMTASGQQRQEHENVACGPSPTAPCVF
mmetsp:Transcript_27404/g.50907  ORF Transcript_27404/g.50907 Transcript_27404/m.50907 type:complete len:86 (-) Transcript_27404:7-264(-)